MKSLTMEAPFGADLKSRKLMENTVSDGIVQEITKYHSIDWKFNNPSASHAGCESRLWWEAQGPSKQSLEMLMKKSVTQPSVAHVSSDSHDLLPLTLSHFLVRKMRGSFTPWNPSRRSLQPQESVELHTASTEVILETMKKGVSAQG